MLRQLRRDRQPRRASTHETRQTLMSLLVLCVLTVVFTEAQAAPGQSRVPTDQTSATKAKANQQSPQSTGGSSGSNASNFGSGTHFSVNPRTGGVSLQAPLFRLAGIRKEIGVSLTLSYQSEDAISDYEAGQGSGGPSTVFGLPYGWSINLSYLQKKSVDDKSYTMVNIDGAQSYVLDQDWTTEIPSTQTVVKTGLQQYNKADVNFRAIQNSDIVVNNLTATYQYSNLKGLARYLSPEGLLIQETDRFGNTIQYFYQCGDAPSTARLHYIVDSWKNRIVFTYPNTTCDPIQGAVTITLPDGRSVGYVVDDQITQLIDAQGKSIRINWQNTNNIPSSCSQYPVPTGMTSPTGAFTTLDYQCMNVCTANTSPNACSATNQTKQWPVALQMFECPSGTPPCTSIAPGAQWTTYTIGGTQSGSTLPDPNNNYTGSPYFSPYTPNTNYPGSDPLMAANSMQKFTYEYQTVVTRMNQGIPTYQTQRTYTFLHLLKESETKVRAKQSDGYYSFQTSKQVSHCYDLPGSNTEGCPLNSEQINYQSLPANYQSPTTSGSCVYSVGGVGSSGGRISVTSHAYDAFGNHVNHRRYHGTTGSGAISSNCTRSTRLDPSPLKLVLDRYSEFDTPTTVTDGFYVLGPGAGIYGLKTASQLFAYLDEDNNQLHGKLGQTTGPIQVTLNCGQLAKSNSTVPPPGSAIMNSTFGLLPNTAKPPSTPGKIPACTSPSWDTSVAPPKLTTYTYDTVGRKLKQVLTWAEGSEQGITSTFDTFTYTQTAGKSNEEACTQATPGENTSPVLQRTNTDAKGNTTISRVCTLNSFPLSATDADGHTVLYQHDATGLVTRLTHSNGTTQTHDYYYQCPKAQSGATCPSSVTACPHDTVTPPRSCTIQTLHAGQQSSYADGVSQITIKDGMNRIVEIRDNLGATASDYSAWQTRNTKAYNNLGLMTSHTDSIGTSDSLTYTTTIDYGPKLRPILVCDPHGVAHETVYDDVAQQNKELFNGHQRELITHNDSRKVVGILDCPVGQDTTATGTGACVTVASDTTQATCDGNVFTTSLLRDGTGMEHSVTATNTNAQSMGASVVSVTGQTTYSADLFKYSYAMQSTPVSSTSAATGNANWSRDLQGMSLNQQLSVKTAFPPNPDTFSSDTFAYNQIAEEISETNKLSKNLMETYTYTPTGMACTRKDYAGTTFTHFYDDMDRSIRFCYETTICSGGSNNGDSCTDAADCPGGTCQGGSEGENYTRDPITGKLLTITHFTNPESCGACSASPPVSKDIAGNTIAMTYTDFGEAESKTYTEAIGGQTETTTLTWSYDEYQRLSCFADVLANSLKSSCPPSPTPAEWWTTNTAPFLTWYVYWPQSDAAQRGLPQSACHRDGSGTIQCVDKHYYSSTEDGACSEQLRDEADVTGAFAGLLSQEQMCTGGSCIGGAGSPVYTTEYEYDPYRRACTVQSCQGGGNCQAG